MIKILPPGLHLILGDSAGGTFTRVFFARDRLLIDHDVLSVGPTPPCTDLDAWTKLRHQFWGSFVPGHGGEHVKTRFDLVDNAQRLAEAERIHIWAATGVSEQLFVAFVVHLLHLVGGNPDNISWSLLEMLNGKRLIGLGELDSKQMRNAPESAPMPTDVVQQYLNAWEALTSPDPCALVNFAREFPEANRWLKLAMQLLTRRFPDKRTGLPYWDHALLSRVATRGPAVSQIIGFTMAETFEQGDLVGDWYLFGRMLRLGADTNAQPLLKLTGDLQSLRHTEAVLTEFGTAVLAGQTSNYPTNAIDDWAAGAHLSSAEGRLWFNDGGKLITG